MIERTVRRLLHHPAMEGGGRPDSVAFVALQAP
jgi:hypothetical protein